MRGRGRGKGERKEEIKGRRMREKSRSGRGTSFIMTGHRNSSPANGKCNTHTCQASMSHVSASFRSCGPVTLFGVVSHVLEGRIKIHL